VHNVNQWPRQLGEPLGGSEILLEAVSFEKATKSMRIEEKTRMPDRSEFQTAGAARLKTLCEVKINVVLLCIDVWVVAMSAPYLSLHV